MLTGPELRAAAGAAVAAGLEHLRRDQLPSGEWRLVFWAPSDADDARPDPSVFATAVIGLALADVPGAAPLLDRAAGFLQATRERHGVWRHYTPGHPRSASVPPDLDDTAMASLVLARVGRSVDNRALLLADRDARGLFFTWVTPRLVPVRSRAFWSVALPQLRHPLQLAGMYRLTPAHRRDVDLVVNANVASYLGPCPEVGPVLDALLGVLRDGAETTCDTWYDDPFVVWYCFSRALRRCGADGRVVLDRLATAEPATALQRALACSVLLDGERAHDDRVAGLVARLVAEQAEDGSWPRAAYYVGGPARSFGSASLTTAVCVEALSRWLEEG